MVVPEPEPEPVVVPEPVEEPVPELKVPEPVPEPEVVPEPVPEPEGSVGLTFTFGFISSQTEIYVTVNEKNTIIKLTKIMLSDN